MTHTHTRSVNYIKTLRLSCTAFDADIANSDLIALGAGGWQAVPAAADTPVRDQKSNFWRRWVLPLPQWDRGGFPPNTTYSERALIRPTLALKL